MSKHDPKLALLARITGAVEIIIDNLKRWFEKKEVPPLVISFNLLKILASKNENTLVTLQKSTILPIIESILKSPP
jgi:hypothetical protein